MLDLMVTTWASLGWASLGWKRDADNDAGHHAGKLMAMMSTAKQGTISVRCVRCQGLMVRSVTSESSTAVNVELGWRCLLCGESTDSCIEANRLNPSPLVRNGARVPGTPVAHFKRARR